MKAKQILVFNQLKKLVAVYRSEYATAKAFNADVCSIRYACNGTCISCKGYYFRELNEDALTMDDIVMSDFKVLTLQEYDRACGVERKIYRTGAMSRKGMKYNMKHKK